jgi:hypothetical protein
LLPRGLLAVERRLDVVFRLAAPPVLRLAAPPVEDLDAVVLRAPAVDLARLPAVFVEEREVEPLLFLAPDERALEEDFRAAPPVARDPLLRDELDELRPPPLLEEELPSIDHLPDMTRCAASATASAISEPSLVALDITDFAALSALSAASIPASLIALRALGLALIAAAAAASPAASISLLIAALASFSVVDLDEPEDDLDDFELLRVLDFAIAKPPFRFAALDK